MKRIRLALLAALIVVLTSGIVVARRPHGPEVTLHFVGKNLNGSPQFVVSNHTSHTFSCFHPLVKAKALPEGTGRAVVSRPAGGRLPSRGSFSFEIDVPFRPALDEVFVMCSSEPSLEMKARQWLRRLGLHVSLNVRTLTVGEQKTTEQVTRFGP